MATTTNYAWTTPDNSGLVKNGAQDIRTLGSSVDTSLWNVGYGQAGKNKIINGDFAINQRTFTTNSGGYGFDRWTFVASGGTGTYSAETFTPGAAPVAGYEAKSFARLATTVGNDLCRLTQKIESVRTFADQTVTLSFWAKGTNPTTPGNLSTRIQQVFGTGGSPSANISVTEQTFVLTANWTRYNFVFVIPSISGKTLGTDGNDSLDVWIGQGSSVSADAWTLDLWGVQLEYGSIATPFQTATGTIQGELAACQRYYVRLGGDNVYVNLASGFAASTTVAQSIFNLPVTQRIASAVVDFSTLSLFDGVTFTAVTAMAFSAQSKNQPRLEATVASGLTQYRPYALVANNSSATYVAFNAEL
jgi:hypothetical protein